MSGPIQVLNAIYSDLVRHSTKDKICELLLILLLNYQEITNFAKTKYY